MCWFSVWSFSLNHRSTLRSIESKRECLVSLRKCVREIKSKYSKCPVNKLKGDVNVFMYLSYFQVAAQFCLQEASLQFYEAETELNMFLCPPGSLFQGKWKCTKHHTSLPKTFKWAVLLETTSKNFISLLVSVLVWLTNPPSYRTFLDKFRIFSLRDVSEHWTKLLETRIQVDMDTFHYSYTLLLSTN